VVKGSLLESRGGCCARCFAMSTSGGGDDPALGVKIVAIFVVFCTTLIASLRLCSAQRN